MAKYRKKPVVIEAVQFKGFDKESGRVKLTERPNWLADKFGKEVLFFDKPGTLTIKTLEGNMIVNIGDYIIKGVQGELYLCKPDIFEMTYEKVNNENPEIITKETSLNVIVKSLVKGKASFLMACPTCGNTTISSQQAYIHDNIKREWYCRNCGQKLNNYNLLKKKKYKQELPG